MPIPNLTKNCALFKGIQENQIDLLLQCLLAHRQTYQKDEFIFITGDTPRQVGIVLSGGVRVLQEDFWGHRVILTHIKPYGLFGEAFACAEKKRLPVSVSASQKSEVLLIDYQKTITTCLKNCQFHTVLIQNMLRILAEKNILLTQKIEHLSKRSIREKLLSYLSSQTLRKKPQPLEIPYDRQELADYLCVDRSALSRELAAMQKEGILRFEKNRFELLKTEKQKYSL